MLYFIDPEGSNSDESEDILEVIPYWEGDRRSTIMAWTNPNNVLNVVGLLFKYNANINFERKLEI